MLYQLCKKCNFSHTLPAEDQCEHQAINPASTPEFHLTREVPSVVLVRCRHAVSLAALQLQEQSNRERFTVKVFKRLLDQNSLAVLVQVNVSSI